MWLAWLVGKLDFKRLKLLGAMLGGVARALRIRRAHVLRAMRRAGVQTAEDCASRMYGNLGTSIFELLWLTCRATRDLDRWVRIDGWERVVAVKRAGGFIVATAHTGNWDLAACYVAEHLALTVVTKHLKNGWLDRFWQTMRSSKGVDLVSSNGTIARCAQALRDGRAVGILIDQAPHRASGTVKLAFLGAPAKHDAAFALLAARYRVPIVVAFARRENAHEHVIEVVDVIEPSRHPDSEWISNTVDRVARQLERFVLAHPDQWLWLHRRWRSHGTRRSSRP